MCPKISLHVSKNNRLCQNPIFFVPIYEVWLMCWKEFRGNDDLSFATGRLVYSLEIGAFVNLIDITRNTSAV